MQLGTNFPSNFQFTNLILNLIFGNSEHEGGGEVTPSMGSVVLPGGNGSFMPGSECPSPFCSDSAWC